MCQLLTQKYTPYLTSSLPCPLNHELLLSKNRGRMLFMQFLPVRPARCLALDASTLIQLPLSGRLPLGQRGTYENQQADRIPRVFR